MEQLKIREIINKIEEDFPINSSMGFDNSGSNVISFDDELKGVLVCLDVTIDAIEYAKKNNINLIVSHHPLIFNDIKNLNDDPVSKRVKLLNKYDINAYSCHTNYDVNIENGMGANLLKMLFKGVDFVSNAYIESFSVDNIKYALGDIISLKNNMSFDSVLGLVKKNLELDDKKIAYYNFNNDIKDIIVIPGSGSGDIEAVIKNKPDLLITSDLKHNHILDLREENISFINATHYGLEKVFVNSFSSYIKELFKDLNVLTFNINL